MGICDNFSCFLTSLLEGLLYLYKLQDLDNVLLWVLLIIVYLKHEDCADKKNI